MPLPSDATIEQIAHVWGVSNRVGRLTPAAKRLTKGQMLRLLGADSEEMAVRMIAVGWKEPNAQSVEQHARDHGIHLTVADIQSLQACSRRGMSRLLSGRRSACASAANILNNGCLLLPLLLCDCCARSG